MPVHRFILKLRYKRDDGESKRVFDLTCRLDDEPSTRAIELILDRYSLPDELALSDAIFKEPIRSMWSRAYSSGREPDSDSQLRFYLYLDPDQPWLQNLAWESMLDPETTKDNRAQPISISYHDWVSFMRTHHEEPQETQANNVERKALIVIVRPTNIVEEGYPDFEVDEYLRLAQSHLAGISTLDILVTRTHEAVTIDILKDKLMEKYTILYLVCHGRQTIDGKPVLLLQDDTGKAALVGGKELETAFLGTIREKHPDRQPRLVILLSCESSGKDAQFEPFYRSLGPQLSFLGVSCVVGYHGLLAMNSAKKFAEVFFKTFAAEGDVDKAVSNGRRSIERKAEGGFIYFSSIKNGLTWNPSRLSSSNSGHPSLPNRSSRSTIFGRRLEDYVRRLQLEQNIITQIKELHESKRNGIICLHGPAGNGKTSLAEIICLLPEVNELFQVQLTSQFEEGFSIQSDKPLLIYLDNPRSTEIKTVVDQVFSGPKWGSCLITTRKPTIVVDALGRGADDLVEIMSMTENEGVELLVHTSGNRLRHQRYRHILLKLVADLHCSPFLIKLAANRIVRRLLNRAYSKPENAIRDTVKQYGLERLNALLDDRNNLERIIIKGNIDELTLTDYEFHWLQQLRVFEEFEEISISVISRLWEVSSSNAARFVEYRLAALSIAEFNSDNQTVRIHALVRDHLITEKPLTVDDHKNLVKVFGDDPLQFDNYAWTYFAHHLYRAEELELLRTCLLSSEWLMLWAKAAGVDVVMRACEHFQETDSAIHLLRRALELSAKTLRPDVVQIATQLSGRFHQVQETDIRDLRDHLYNWSTIRWIRSALIQAESQLERVYSSNGKYIGSFGIISEQQDTQVALGVAGKESRDDIVLEVRVLPKFTKGSSFSTKDVNFYFGDYEYDTDIDIISHLALYNSAEIDNTLAFTEYRHEIKGLWTTMILVDTSKCAIYALRADQIDGSNALWYGRIHGSCKTDVKECALKCTRYTEETNTIRDEEEKFCGRVSTFATSQSGKWAACSFEDNRLIVWNMDSREAFSSVLQDVSKQEVSALAIAENGDTTPIIVLALKNGPLQVYLDDKKYLLEDHRLSNVSAIAISESSGYLVLGMVDGTIIWGEPQLLSENLMTLTDVRSTKLPSQVTELVVSRDKSVVLATCVGNPNIYVWHPDQNDLPFLLPVTSGSKKIGLSGEGRFALCLTQNGELWMWDLNRSRSSVFSGHGSRVEHVIIDEVTSLAYTTSSNNIILAWDLKTGLQKDIDSSYSPMNRLTAEVEQDNIVIRNNVSRSIERVTKLPKWNEPLSLRRIFVSNNADMLALLYGGNENRVCIGRDFGGIKRSSRTFNSAPSSVCVTDNRLFVATGRELSVWDQERLQARRPLLGITLDSDITACAATSDSKFLVIGDEAGGVHILDLSAHL